MTLLPLLCSLTGFLIAFFFGKFLNRTFAAQITTFFLGVSWISALHSFYWIGLCKNIVHIPFYTWIKYDWLEIPMAFQIDTVTVTMLVVVTTVSFFTHMYSIEYMAGDPHQIRFMSYLSLFTFFMLILVTANNLFQLFLGWEGVGICSYLLINFWYTRIQANKSSIMAILTNKIGDVALMVAIALVLLVCKTTTFTEVYSSIMWLAREDAAFQHVDLIGVLLVIAMVGKSAQAGLHIWLPEAMEGPTPVSSLIHAATMVTAGIFLLLRCSFILEQIPSVLISIALIGAITAFLGASIGVFQNDLKKIIAYSTCSQLGYMVMACGYSSYTNGLFHLFNHAFFKALLFLTAGYIIHATANEQDMRRLGGYYKLLPFAYAMILIGSIAIMGIPFYSGFYSKEKILMLFYTHFNFVLDESSSLVSVLYLASFIAFLAMIFTIIYSIKLLIMTFFSTTNSWQSTLYTRTSSLGYTYKVHYASLYIYIPLMVLATLSLLSGYVFQDMFVGVGTDFWNGSLLYPNTSFSNIYENCQNIFFVIFNYEFNNYVHNIPLVWTIYYTYLFIVLYTVDKKYILDILLSSRISTIIHIILTEKYLFYNKLIIEPVTYKLLSAGKTTFLLFDKGLIELIGPYSIVQSLQNLMIQYQKQQTGYFTYYLHVFLLFILICIQIVVVENYI
jgi:NADH-ubiquinone oxidoreductase chain 5